MSTVYEESFYYSVYDSGAKYKVNGDKLDEIILGDGTVLDALLRDEKFVEYGMIKATSWEKVSSERSECSLP